MYRFKINANHLRKTACLGAIGVWIFLLIPGCNLTINKNQKASLVDTDKTERGSSLLEVKELPDTTKSGAYVPPEISKEAMQKAVISKLDSSFNVYNNIRADYRIIGYESPDTNARKMVLFSVFTSDVKDNPFQCPYGSYYDSAQGDELVIKYVGQQGSFIKAHISGIKKKPATIYFEKNWVEFGE